MKGKQLGQQRGYLIGKESHHMGKCLSISWWIIPESLITAAVCYDNASLKSNSNLDGLNCWIQDTNCHKLGCSHFIQSVELLSAQPHEHD